MSTSHSENVPSKEHGVPKGKVLEVNVNKMEVENMKGLENLVTEEDDGLMLEDGEYIAA